MRPGDGASATTPNPFVELEIAVLAVIVQLVVVLELLQLFTSLHQELIVVQ
jgi:hypothetical protein